MLSENKVSVGTLPNREQVAGEVKQVLAESIGVPIEELRETTLLRDLPWDSLDLVEFTMELEEQFNISISDEWIAEAKTIGDVADGVSTLLAGACDER